MVNIVDYIGRRPWMVCLFGKQVCHIFSGNIWHIYLHIYLDKGKKESMLRA
jgi:hypothetical protein